MATIGSLAVNVIARTERFTAGLRKGRRELALFNSAIGRAKGVLVGFGATLAAGFTIGGLKRTAIEIDNIAKLADPLGITTEKLIGLQHASEISGGSAEELSKGLIRLSRNIGNAAIKGGDAAKALDRLGLSVMTLKGLEADEQFLRIAGAIAKLPTAAERTSTAMDLFGRSGIKLLPLINEGEQRIRALIAEADRLGLTFSREAASGVEEMNDAMTRTMAAVKGLARELTITLAPAVQDIADRLTNLLMAGRGATIQEQIAAMSDAEFKKFRGAIHGKNVGARFEAAFGIGVSPQDFAGPTFSDIFKAEGGPPAVQAVIDWWRGISKAGLQIEEAIRARQSKDVAAMNRLPLKMWESGSTMTVQAFLKQISSPGAISARTMMNAPAAAFIQGRSAIGDLFGRGAEKLGEGLTALERMERSTQRQGLLAMLFGGKTIAAAKADPNAIRPGFDPNRIAELFPMRGVETRGNAALERGTAAAFSQERRSAQQNQLVDLSRRHLIEAKKMAKSLEKIEGKDLGAQVLPANLV